MKKIKLKDFPKEPLEWAITWKEKHLDSIDFDVIEEVVINDPVDFERFSYLAHKMSLSVIIILEPPVSLEETVLFRTFENGIVVEEEFVNEGGIGIKTTFEYNELGQISRMDSSDGKFIKILYNEQGRMIDIDADRRTKKTLRKAARTKISNEGKRLFFVRRGI